VYVSCDNCSDNTADVARSHGAVALIRRTRRKNGRPGTSVGPCSASASRTTTAWSCSTPTTWRTATSWRG
jgi:hypothetical protein